MSINHGTDRVNICVTLLQPVHQTEAGVSSTIRLNSSFFLLTGWQPFRYVPSALNILYFNSSNLYEENLDIFKYISRKKKKTPINLIRKYIP